VFNDVLLSVLHGVKFDRPAAFLLQYFLEALCLTL